MKPVTEKAGRTGKSAESMTFSYSAVVPRSAAYDGTTVYSPEPIFRKLANLVDLHMDYKGEPSRIRVNARMSADNGWHTTLQLSQQQQFTSAKYTGTVQLDLDALSQRAKSAGEAIGADINTVTLAVTAQVEHSDGSLFEPNISLNLAPLQMTLSNGSGSLVVNQSSTAAETSTQDRQIDAFGYDVFTAAEARKYAIYLLLTAAIGAVVIAALALRHVPLRTRVQIERRYPHLIVPVEPMASPPGKPIVLVDSFRALVKLAEKYGQMILTWTRADGSDDFVVRDEGIIYRYRITAAQTTIAEAEAAGSEPKPAKDSRSNGDISPVSEASPVPDLPFGPQLRTEPTTARPNDESATEELSEAGEPAKSDEPQKRTSPRKRATKTAAAKATTSRSAATKAAATKAAGSRTAGTRTAAGSGTADKTPAKRTRSAAKPATEPVVSAESDQPTTPENAEQVSAVIRESTATAVPSSSPADAEPSATDEPTGTAETGSAEQPEKQTRPATSGEVVIALAGGHAVNEGSEAPDGSAVTEAGETPVAIGAVKSGEAILGRIAAPDVAGQPVQPETSKSAGENGEAEAIKNTETVDEITETVEAEVEAARSAEPEIEATSERPEPVEPTELVEALPGAALADGQDEPVTGAVDEISTTRPDEPLSTSHAELAVPESEAGTKARHRAEPDDQPSEQQKPARGRKRAGRRSTRAKKAAQPLRDELVPARAGDKPGSAERDEAAPALAERELAREEMRELAREEMADLAGLNRPIGGDAGLDPAAGGEPEVPGPGADRSDPRHEPIYDFLPLEKRPGTDPGDEEVELESDREDRRV